MTRSGPSRWRHVSAVSLILLALTAGCGVKKDSPAPGCIEYWGLAPMMGGCAGTTAILDLQVEPVLDCLVIEVNNCNGGVLEVTNRCTETLVLGGVEIEPDEHSVSLDVLEKQEDSYLLIENYSNFSDYLPAQDEAVTVLGTLGDRPIRVTFIKTKALC